ncbi:MAG: hypothetical protein ABJA66_17725 [Actinomycetota bacterium]
MVQEIIKPKYRTCFTCNYETETIDRKCPHCGKRLLTQTEIRLRGVILVICGASLAFILGNLAVWALGVLFVPNNSEAISQHGGIVTVTVLLIVFSFIFLLGLAFLAAGIWQVLFGRRNLKIVFIISLLLFIFILGGQLLTILLLGKDLFA